jgi:hypothetical protein
MICRTSVVILSVTLFAGGLHNAVSVVRGDLKVIRLPCFEIHS